MKRILVAAALGGAALAGCTIREARIAMPAHLENSVDRLEVSGMGVGTRGDFSFAGGRGMFTRSAERLGIFDPLLVKHSGGGSFLLANAAGLPDLAARCTYREGTVNVGPISITPRRLAFHCDFARDGRPIDAALILEDPKDSLGTLHGRDERLGMLYYEGRRIDVRSIHRDQSGGLPARTPLGYMFSQDGQEVGAVDLNGTGKTIFAPRTGAEREAVIAAGLALSTFWDPAEFD